MKKIIILIIFLLFVSCAYAQEEPLESFDDSNVPVYNDGLQDQWRRIRKLQSYTSFIPSTGVIPLANGGTGSALVDPDADRIGFWDDSEGIFTWLTVGDGLTVTGTTITADDEDVLLLDTNTITGATQTGDMTIAASSMYKLIFYGQIKGDDAQVGIKFNNDTDGHYGYLETYDSDDGLVRFTDSAAAAIYFVDAGELMDDESYFYGVIDVVNNRCFGFIETRNTEGNMRFVRLFGNHDAVPTSIELEATQTINCTISLYEFTK